MSVKVKEVYDVESKYGAFYTGGNVEWHNDILYCQKNSSISLLNVEDGTVKKTIGSEDSEDADIIQTFTTNGEIVVSSYKSGLLKLWNQDGDLEKMWKYIHKGPISKLTLNGKTLASGGADGVVRIWDLEHKACTSSLRSCQGVIGVITFIDDQNVLISGDDGKIHLHELTTGKLKMTYSEHFSKVVSVVLASKEGYFVSCGRDKVLILWSLESNKPLKTIPLYEATEAIVALPIKFKVPGYKADPENIYVASGGENGNIRIWNVSKAKEVYCQSESLISKAKEEGGLAIANILFSPKQKVIALISVEQNIIFYHLKSFACLRQFTGFSDEILDIVFIGKEESHLAVATNSSDIKLYENATMNCKLLKGHSDIVLALSVSKSNPNLLLSSSKDNMIMLWYISGETAACVGIGNRHTSSVGSVCFSETSTSFAVSVSQDTCVKLWEIPPDIDNKDKHHLSCTHTEIAHQKDINCVIVSPNDQIIATASQDKTAKLWTSSLTLVGILKGHRRGVWSVRFSPVDQVVATSSADCTIKLWSISDLSCLKTFEGHESSVLRVEFLSNGLQLISTGGDGLLKLFTIKTSECNLTLDEHEDRIWALAISKDESCIVTGGADSVLVKWKDVTEQRRLEQVQKDQEMLLQEQKLSNYVQSDQLQKALSLALDLEKPYQTLRIIRGIIKKSDLELCDAVKGLTNHQKESLLNSAVTWNTNSKNCQVAQLVLNILINELQSGQFRPNGLNQVIEGALPYTERHFKRLTQLMQELHLLNYTIQCMQPHVKNC